MAKGGSTEREVCVLLSKWVTEGKRDDIFDRSNSSGARFTQRKKSGKDTAFQAGDIAFSDPIGLPICQNWSIECKSGYGSKRKIKDEQGNLVKKIDERWDVLDRIDSQQKETVLEKMWAQCCRDAVLTNRQPILIFRRNRRELCIMITCRYESELSDFFGANLLTKITISCLEENTVIMKLKDFFLWIPNIEPALKRPEMVLKELPLKRFGFKRKT